MRDNLPLPVFNDGKAPDALRTIGEVANALGLRQHVLRYWEEQFPALKPVKRSGGRRYYRPDDVRLIALIDRLVHKEGYTLRGARQAIRSGETASPPQVSPPAASVVSGTVIAEIQAIRDNLARAVSNA